MGEPRAGGYVPLTRRFSALAVGLAFYVGPIAIVGSAVSARTSGIVVSRATVEERLLPLAGLARAAAQAEGLAPELVLAVASVESSGRRDARSREGALGLMQVLPSTAADVATDLGIPRPDLFDPATSFRVGARYLADQVRAWDGHAAAVKLALCAYNAGPAKVRTWMRERPVDPASSDIGELVPPSYVETSDYVRRVGEWEIRWRETLAR